MLLISKCCGIQKKKKSGREIKENSDDNPEFFGIVYKKDGRIFDLYIQE
jgi:hypothetical protein